MTTILPVQISALAWFAELSRDWPNENIPGLYHETEWRDVAARIVELPTFQAKGAPSPDAFADWSSWATRFVEVVDATV